MAELFGSYDSPPTLEACFERRDFSSAAKNSRFSTNPAVETPNCCNSTRTSLSFIEETAGMVASVVKLGSGFFSVFEGPSCSTVFTSSTGCASVERGAGDDFVIQFSSFSGVGGAVSVEVVPVAL